MDSAPTLPGFQRPWLVCKNDLFLPFSVDGTIVLEQVEDVQANDGTVETAASSSGLAPAPVQSDTSGLCPLTITNMEQYAPRTVMHCHSHAETRISTDVSEQKLCMARELSCGCPCDTSCI